MEPLEASKELAFPGIRYPWYVAWWATLAFHSRRPIFLAASSVLPLGGCFLIYFLASRPQRVTLADILVVAICFLFVPVMTLAAVVATRWRNRLTRGPFLYVFDDSGMHVTGESVGARFGWTAFGRVRETRSFLFIHLAPGGAQCIPMRDLTPSGQMPDLRILIARHVRDVRMRSQVP